MTSFALVIWAYEQSGSAFSTVGVLVLLSTDALCVWCVGAVLGWLPIPLGNHLGGALVDTVFEPFMAQCKHPKAFSAACSAPAKAPAPRFCSLSSASSASLFSSASAAASLSAGWKRTTKIKKLNQTTNTEYFKYDS